MKADRRVTIAVVALVAVWLTPVPRACAAQAEESGGHSPIVIVGTVLTNIVYFPSKLVYAAVGGIVGALAYPVTVGNSDVSMAIWDASCRGTYVVTPSMMEGKERIRFSGP